MKPECSDFKQKKGVFAEIICYKIKYLGVMFNPNATFLQTKIKGFFSHLFHRNDKLHALISPNIAYCHVTLPGSCYCTL